MFCNCALCTTTTIVQPDADVESRQIKTVSNGPIKITILIYKGLIIYKSMNIWFMVLNESTGREIHNLSLYAALFFFLSLFPFHFVTVQDVEICTFPLLCRIPALSRTCKAFGSLSCHFHDLVCYYHLFCCGCCDDGFCY